MNTKFLTLALGGLLLSSSAVSFADGRGGEHRDGPPAYRSSHDHDGFRDGRPYWHEYWHPDFRAGPRWYAPQPHGRWAPVPEWRHSDYPDHWGRGDAYDRDGVTIIYRGHLN